MAPVGGVVAGPDGRGPLTADEERPSEDEWAQTALGALQMALVGGGVLKFQLVNGNSVPALPAGTRRCCECRDAPARQSAGRPCA